MNFVKLFGGQVLKNLNCNLIQSFQVCPFLPSLVICTFS